MIYTLKIIPIRNSSKETTDIVLGVTKDVLEKIFNSINCILTEPYDFPINELMNSKGGRRFIEGDIVKHSNFGTPYYNEFEFLDNQSKDISLKYGTPF